MPASIFKGSKVKTLKQNLTLNDAVDIQSGSTDPTSSAVDAPQGSLYLNTSNGLTYRKLDSGSSTNWSILGSSGASGVNYITNPDAEANTTGWSTYADTATPTTLTGGSATATWTRDTGTPLRGIASFLYTAGAVGNGVATVITPASADIKAGAVQVLALEYSVSGTIAEGDYQIWVYDVANSAIIQPTGYKIPSAVSGQAYKLQPVTFQLPTNGTTFRVAIHQAVASPGGNLKVDSISVGPQTRSYGPAVTSMVDTPTAQIPNWGNLTVGNGTFTHKQYRVGDRMYFEGQLTWGSTTSIAGTVSVGLPNGMSIDTAKSGTSVRNPIGHFKGYDSSTGTVYQGVVRYASATSVSLKPFITVASSTYVDDADLTSTVPITWATGDIFFFKYDVPVVGLESTTELSSSTDTRVVAARIGTSGAPTGTIASSYGSSTTIQYNSVTHDSHGAYVAATGYTIPVSGYYKIYARQYISHASVSVGNEISLGILKNGSVQSATTIVVSSASVLFYFPQVQDLRFFNAGDIITVKGTSNGTTPVTAADSTGNMLSVERLSGPSVIAASEFVGFEASASTTAVTGGGTVINPTELFDSHGAYDSSTGIFTVPTPGIYEVEAAALTASYAAAAAGEIFGIRCEQSGSASTIRGGTIDRSFSTTSRQYSAHLVARFKCQAGDTLRIKFDENIGAVNLDGNGQYNHFSAIKVG